MSTFLKRSMIAAALAMAGTVSMTAAQADPLFYKTRPGSRPPTSSAARSAGAPVQSYSSTPSTTRSYSYAPSSPVRSYSYAPSAPQSTVRSYSHAPGTTQRAPVQYYRSAPCYCNPR